MRRRPLDLGTAGMLATSIVLGACGGSPLESAPPPAPAETFAATRWSFDQDPAGSVPRGMSVFAGRWAVRAEAGTPSAPNALCQTATAEFPALQLSSELHRDMAVSARFKPISGREDQAGGVLLRVRDAKNYYIVRANALEGNVVIFKYVDGRRSEIKSGAATVPSGTWQLLRAEAIGTRIRGYLGGTLVVEGEDSTFGEGGAGLWTKADSVTCFDDVVLGPVGG